MLCRARAHRLFPHHSLNNRRDNRPQNRWGETADTVGESTVRWLSGQDVLQVDELIVSPGASGITLPGDLAR
jgi:hypothetical protein